MTRQEGQWGRPAVTVSLVTFNGLRWLPGCLASLAAQDMYDSELLIIDNASTDGSVDWLREHTADDPRSMFTESRENLGYAKAHNQNIALARGEYVCLLNQDVELDAGFLREALAPFSLDSKIGSVQGRVRRLAPSGERTEILDSTGLVMLRDRRFVSRSQGERESDADLIPGAVFGADGPAPVYRRAAVLDARLPATAGGWEVLDEDFFMYKEDVDLAWRLRLLGWTAWYQPRALAWHARGAAGPHTQTLFDIARTSRRTPPWIRAVSWRNQRLTQVKNESFRAFIRDLPWILRREILSMVFILLADRARLRILPSTLRLLPKAWRKRRFLSRKLSGRSRWSQC